MKRCCLLSRLLALVLMIVSTISLMADESVRICGKVVDKETGIPIGGASIRAKGEVNFWMRSFWDGTFSMLVKPGMVLWVSYDGKETEAVRVLKSQKEYLVELKDQEDKVYQKVGREPSFPGGKAAFDKFISENMRWVPGSSFARWIFVSFIVQKDGTLTHIGISHGGNKAMEAEALRLVRQMPKWEPAMRRGEPVAFKSQTSIWFPGKSGMVEMIDFFPDWEEEKKLWAEEDEDGVCQYIEVMPQFPGGETECMNFINRNFKHPKGKRRQSKMTVRFIIEKDGSLNLLEVIPHWDSLYIEEMSRVIRMMPNWIPGKHHGEIKAVEHFMKIDFSPHQ